MPYPLIIKEGARLDMQEAYNYYERQQAGLGERFLLALQKRFASLSEYPEYYSFIDENEALRDVSVDRFPYVIIYAIINEQVRVYAIHLTHKRPRIQYPE